MHAPGGFKLSGAFLCGTGRRTMSAAGESRTCALRDEGSWSGSRVNVALLIGAFILIWTVYPTFTRINLDQYGDMLENYAWGIGWQWGYFKHPPFFTWTTAAWFEIFPNADWAYYLLSALNAGLAIFFSCDRKSVVQGRGAVFGGFRLHRA